MIELPGRGATAQTSKMIAKRSETRPNDKKTISSFGAAEGHLQVIGAEINESSAQSSQPDRKSLEPVKVRKQSSTQQIPQQQKATCSLVQPKPNIQHQKPPIPKQQFALPTREQTSLAEQRRREAKKETPITSNEREMNEKEIHHSKSLLMCFLSASYSSDEAVVLTKTKSGYNYATSKHVDNYQHDTSNHPMAYHYSVPTSEKKRKYEWR